MPCVPGTRGAFTSCMVGHERVTRARRGTMSSGVPHPGTWGHGLTPQAVCLYTPRSLDGYRDRDPRLSVGAPSVAVTGTDSCKRAVGPAAYVQVRHAARLH